jgi:hypothetical protein
MARFCSRLSFIILVWGFVASTFAADLQTPKEVIPESYFGMHIHHLASQDPTPWPDVPVPQWRLWDALVTWPDLEPNKGQWQFEKLDAYVALAQQHGTGILLPLGGSPHWASARPTLPSDYYPGFTAEPANIEDWRTFVKTVALRYKGRIHAYEVWNEPNLKQFWTGTTDQMLTLTKEASQIIHGVDPNAIVVSPAATSDYGIPWLAEFLKKGGGQYVDAIGFHLYVNPSTLPPEDMVPLIQHVRQVMSDNGVANKPLWNTESGWLPPAKFASDDLAAAALARAFIVSWAAGLQRFYWYAWDNISLAIVPYKRDEHRITLAASAYKTTEQWLVGARMESCGQSTDHTWTCQLNRSGKKAWILWNPQGHQKFDLPGSWHVRSITPLLENSHPLQGTSVDIGPVPVLLT